MQNLKGNLRRYLVMIKSIESQKPVQIAIIRDGKIVAHFYTYNITGSVDIDKIKVNIDNSHPGEYNIELEV